MQVFLRFLLASYCGSLLGLTVAQATTSGVVSALGCSVFYQVSKSKLMLMLMPTLARTKNKWVPSCSS